MSFTAAVAAHLVGFRKSLRIGLWTWFAVTTAGTIYLGWHYVLDDVGGVVLGAIALALAAVLTGVDLGATRQRRRATARAGTDGQDGPVTRPLATATVREPALPERRDAPARSGRG